MITKNELFMIDGGAAPAPPPAGPVLGNGADSAEVVPAGGGALPLTWGNSVSCASVNVNQSNSCIIYFLGVVRAALRVDDF